MKIKAEIDEKYNDIELHVCNDVLNSEVKEILGELHETFDRAIAGVDERGNRVMISRSDVISVFAEGQKVMVLDTRGTYTVQKKLYELESELGDTYFARISKSEIVNVRKIKNLDMSITGTIKITMKTGYETFVSRRNVPKIKEKLLKERKVEQG